MAEVTLTTGQDQLTTASVSPSDLNEVVARERALLDPAIRADTAVAGRLIHPDFVEFGRSGRIWTRASLLAMMAKDPSVGDDPESYFDFSPAPLGPDVMLLTYSGPDGTRRSSTWMRVEGEWTLRFHQATPLPQSDPQPATPRPPATPAPPRTDAVPVLAVKDAQRALEWYSLLGFVEQWRHRFAAGLPFYIGVARPDGALLHLSERPGDSSGETLVALTVPNLRAIAEAIGVPMIDGLPWSEDLEVQDPDGNRLRLSQIEHPPFEL